MNCRALRRPLSIALCEQKHEIPSPLGASEIVQLSFEDEGPILEYPKDILQLR
jgi:hypothetical protein